MTAGPWRQALRRWAPRVATVVLLAWACVVLWREVRALDPQDVAAHMRAWGAWRIAAASALSAASFALVAVVEWMGLRWSGAPLPWRTAALRSFMVNGLIHTLGANVVTAALTRAWVYRRTGLRLTASAATTGFAAVTLFAGLAVVTGAALVISGPDQLRAIRLGVLAARIGGAALLALVAAYLAACAAWPQARLFGEVRLPRFSYAVAQVAIGAVDNLVSSALLWLLISGPAPPFGAFAVAYVLAYLGGLLSAAPGGAGVFEAGVFLLLPGTPRAALAAAFLGFRLIFYLAPFVAALGLVAAELLRPARDRG
jgi:uncharacterized membrane protein YbhN (UPF0104 family)